MTTPRQHRAARLATLAAALLLARCAWSAKGSGPPAAAPRELEAETVVFRSRSGSTIHGWLSRGRPGAGAVLLLHGIGASRQEMVARARFLHAAGYAVLLVDFRAHGESTGADPTYGALESRDARAALAQLRAAAPGERVGVIGISMGGAAALLGPGPLPVQALVLESVYPTIEAAVRNRLRAWLGPVGPPLTRLALDWLFPSHGVVEADLRPIDRVGWQTAPLLIASGTADPYTTDDETRALFDRASSPKELWEVERAGHVDLYDFAGAEYERRVGGFLARWLRPAGHPSGPGLASAGGTPAR